MSRKSQTLSIGKPSSGRMEASLPQMGSVIKVHPPKSYDQSKPKLDLDMDFDDDVAARAKRADANKMRVNLQQYGDAMSDDDEVLPFSR